jgi:hypothetical protein
LIRDGVVARSAEAPTRKHDETSRHHQCLSGDLVDDLLRRLLALHQVKRLVLPSPPFPFVLVFLRAIPRGFTKARDSAQSGRAAVRRTVS